MEMSPFARTIMSERYSQDLPNGQKETWPDIAKRVTSAVFSATPKAPAYLAKHIEHAIRERRFMPGGRYLVAAGRSKGSRYTNNCFLLRAEDTREGWGDVLSKVAVGSMTGGGMGTVYSDLREKGRPLKSTGGSSSGPLPLMLAVNEVGRAAVQGGSRRAALWAGLHWNHPDVFDFIKMKDWPEEIRALKARDHNAAAPMDGTNISVILDDAFFLAYSRNETWAYAVFWETLRHACETGDPGFSIDVGPNVRENLRNPCVTGDTEVLTDLGYFPIAGLVDTSVNVWNGFEWSEVTPRVTGHDRPILRVGLSSGMSLDCTENHEFWLTRGYPSKGAQPVKVEAKDLKIGDKLIKHDYPVLADGEVVDPALAYSQGFISGDGMDNYDWLYLYAPKYACAGRMAGHVTSAAEYRGRVSFKMHFKPRIKTFVPSEWNLGGRINWLAGLLDSDGTELKEGGSQIGSVDRDFLLRVQRMLTTMGVASKVTAAAEAGMRRLPDGHGGSKDFFCQDAYRLLIGSVQMQQLKLLGLKCERMSFHKSPQRDATRFVTVTSVAPVGIAATVYCFTEPKRNLGCFNGIVTGQCCEITSEDDSDVCCLGSINLARVKDLAEFGDLVDCASALLLAGTVYSDVPYAKVEQVRQKNRRLGLGLMGIHEFVAVRGLRYGSPEAHAALEPYLKLYAESTDAARAWAHHWKLSYPVKTRALAPTGTIGIIAETTTGIEPIFCAAYKRRYDDRGTWMSQYVTDPTARRLVGAGMHPDDVEDAYTIDVETRVAHQAFVQQYVDHAISSTLNLPPWGSPQNSERTLKPFGEMLLSYLPRLRGLTMYPDAARTGQPLQRVSFAEALEHEGEVFQADVCDLRSGSSCGA